MIKSEYSRLLKDLERWTNPEKLSFIDTRVWTDMFKPDEVMFNIARAAIDKLYVYYPPYRSFGKLPPIAEYKNEYEKLIESKHKKIPKCLCCNSSTFIMDPRTERVYDCPSCWLKSGRPPRTKSHLVAGLHLCDNFDCRADNPKECRKDVLRPKTDEEPPF